MRKRLAGLQAELHALAKRCEANALVFEGELARLEAHGMKGSSAYALRETGAALCNLYAEVLYSISRTRSPLDDTCS